MGVSGTGSTELPDHEVEIEWQFDALDLRPVERWLAALPLQAATDPASTVTAQAKPGRRLVDRYLDTDDWRIGRAGFVLRTRRRGRHVEATLKDDKPAEATGLRSRLEVTEPLPEGDIRRLSSDGPVGTRVRAVAGRRPLRQVVEVRTRRRPYAVRVGGEEVAELVLDETAIVVGSGERPLQLRRVEVEVVAAWADHLAPMVEELRQSCGLQPASLSKYEAGLLAIGQTIPAEPDLGPTEITPDSTLSELAFAILRRHLAVVLAREPGTRLGEDIEELHDMRVGTRRLRAAIDLFDEVLGTRASAINTELRWLAGVLGAVRDLDVQLERMDQMDQIAASWAERTTGEPLAEVRQVLERHREQERQKLLAALDSPRWDRLVGSLTSLVTRRPVRTRSGRLPAVLVMPAMVSDRHHKVVRAARRARRSGDPADYHRLRIRAKRLRYSLEFTSDLYGPRTDRFTRRLARLQDRLGLLQDAEVATARLFELAMSSTEPLGRETVFAMGGVAEWYRADAAALLRELPSALPVVKGKEWQDLASHMERRREEAEAAVPSDRAPRAPRAPRITPPEGGADARPEIGGGAVSESLDGHPESHETGTTAPAPTTAATGPEPPSPPPSGAVPAPMAGAESGDPSDDHLNGSGALVTDAGSATDRSANGERPAN